MDEWQREEVRTEVRSRTRNEWIETTKDAFGETDEAGMATFACECSFRGCESLIQLTRAEYEFVREHGGYFAIALDHENPELDRLVEEFQRYALIEKLTGEPKDIAVAADPRLHPSGARKSDEGPRDEGRQ